MPRVHRSQPGHREASPDARPATQLRLVIASDVRLYRDGLASILAREDGVEAAATAGSPEETVAAVAAESPDVLLIDVAMHGSLDVVRSVREHGCACVVALALPETASTFVPCVEAGICAYVPREASTAELLRVVRSAARGEPIIAPKLTGSLLSRVFSMSERFAPPRIKFDLTRREEDVAALLARGKSNKRIAAELNIGVATVKNHVHNILRKMKVSRRAEVATVLGRRPPVEVPDLGARRRLDRLVGEERSSEGSGG